MLNAKRLSIVALALAAGLHASAQAPKISGLVQIWYTQMMDDSLRLNNTQGAYQLRDEFRENGISIRRTESKLAGSVGDDVDWEVMFDPTLIAFPILQDAAISYKLPNKIVIKAGQFKNLQTLEGLTSSSELLLIERSQMAKRWGDVRDRGLVASMGFGDTKALAGRVHLGMFNGNAKNLQNNDQMDLVGRLEMTYGKQHSFGAYTLQGATNLLNNERTPADTLQGGHFRIHGTGQRPTYAAVLDNNDATSQMGAYYRYQDDKIHASFELITGQVGRLFNSLVNATQTQPSTDVDGNPITIPANVNGNRQHLDQAFMGYVATFGYTFGKHSVAARYDFLNYNSGDDWYGDGNPYVNTAAGTDYTPQYTEITVGYTYAFMPEKIKNANIKVNYVMRSKNFLAPRGGQTGEQGGDTLYVCFQTAF
jgi:hypothetical protein